MIYGNSLGSSEYTKGDRKNFQKYQLSHPDTIATTACKPTFRLLYMNTFVASMTAVGAKLPMNFAVFVALGKYNEGRNTQEYKNTTTMISEKMGERRRLMVPLSQQIETGCSQYLGILRRSQSCELTCSLASAVTK